MAHISIAATQNDRQIWASDEIDISGKPTGGFLAVPEMTDLDHFRVRRISIHIAGKGWAYDDPTAGTEYPW